MIIWRQNYKINSINISVKINSEKEGVSKAKIYPQTPHGGLFKVPVNQ
jgi:hypothetical protein